MSKYTAKVVTGTLCEEARLRRWDQADCICGTSITIYRKGTSRRGVYLACINEHEEYVPSESPWASLLHINYVSEVANAIRES